MSNLFLEQALIYGMSAIILGVPQSVCAYQVLRQGPLRGFVYGLVTIALLIMVGYILLSLPLFPECKFDAINCEWIPLTFILWILMAGLSAFSLIPSALLFHNVCKRMAVKRNVQTSWRKLIVSLAPMTAILLSSFVMLYPSSSGMLLEKIVAPVAGGGLIGYIMALVIIVLINGLLSALMFALAFYALASKGQFPDSSRNG